MVRCFNCGSETLLPVEPLYSRTEVCALVPVKASQLARWMQRNRGQLSPPQYTGPTTHARRLFTAQDIRTLRAALVRSNPRGQ